MPSQKINLRPKGLYTNVNQLGSIPPGALANTENVVISRPGVLGCRRGRQVSAFFASKQDDAWVPGSQPIRLFNAKLRVGGQYVTNYMGEQIEGIIAVMLDGTIHWSPDGDTFTRIPPTFGEPAVSVTAAVGGRHFNAFEQQGSLFLNTAEGVIVIGRPIPNTPNYGGIPGSTEIQQDWTRSGYAVAGTPWGLVTETVTAPAGTSAVPAGSQVGYRFCFGYRDTNNIIHLGAPSSRSVYINATAGALDVVAKTMIPPGINRYRHFYQLYKTQPSSASTTDPGDDCILIQEGSIPQEFNINFASVAAGVATLDTPAPHGLTVAGQLVNLKQDIIGPVVSTYDTFAILNSAVPGIFTVSRQILLAAPTAVASLDFNTTRDPFYGPIDETDLVTMRGNDTIGRSYVVGKKTRRLYILNANGTVNSFLDITAGWYLNNAAMDDKTGKIYALARPGFVPGSGWTFSGNQALLCIYDPTTGLFTYSYTNPLPSQWSIQNVIDGRMGFYRRDVNTPLALCLCLPPAGSIQGVGAALDMFMSYNNGLSWVVLRANAGVYDIFTHTLTCAVSITNPISGATTFHVGVQHSGTDLQSNFRGYAELIQVNTLSNGQAYCYYSFPNLIKVNVGVVVPIYSDIVLDASTGRINVVGLNPNGALVDAFVKEFINPYRVDGTWSELGVQTNAQGFPRCVDYTTTAIGITVPWTGNTVRIFTKLSAASPLLFATYTLAQYGGTSVPPGFWTGPSTTITPIINSGAYAVVSIVTPNRFTINTSSIAFTGMIVTAFAEQMEITYTDSISPSFSGPYLYSSPSVEGALQMNFPPPLCEDAALFRTTAFYANTKVRSVIQVSLVTLPTTGNRIYLGDNTVDYFTASTVSENVQNRQYRVFTGGSFEANARATIESLCRVINAWWGKFKHIVTPAGVGTTASFTFILSGRTAADKIIWSARNSTNTAPDTSFTPNYVFGEVAEGKNIIHYSKPGQPDAVPLLNTLRIGSDTKGILRILASRDALFVFKEDGCFIVRGYGPPWQVDPYDLTLHLTIRDSLVQLDNALFGAFSRGIFKVSDSNVELLSLPIQDQIERHTLNDTKSDNYGFGLADNSDHKYLLFVPRIASDIDYTDEVYVYDTFTNEWTKWAMGAMHGICYKNFHLVWAWREPCFNGPVNATNTIGLAYGEYPAILKENKTLTDSDFTDGPVYCIPEKSANGITLYARYWNPTAKTLLLWDGIDYPGSVVPKYSAIVPFPELADFAQAAMPINGNDIGLPVTLYQDYLAWILPNQEEIVAVIVYKPIPFEFMFAQAFPETPAATNHFSECAVSFREVYFASLDAVFSLPVETGDNRQGPHEVTVNGWKHFGKFRVKSYNNFIRNYVPRQAQRGTTLLAGIRTGACGFPIECNGITIMLTQGPTSFQRR